MSGFLYFLESCQVGQVHDLLPKSGLRYVLTPSLMSREASTGPGAMSGVVVADSNHVAASDLGFFPDRQTWRRKPGQEGVWVGVGGVKPGPEDLQLPVLLSGADVIMGDGQSWRVPFARYLPRMMELDDQGRWVVGNVVERYRSLYEIAIEWLDAKTSVFQWMDDHDGSADEYQDQRLELDWLFSRSVDVLAANYAIGPVESSFLGLFVTGSRFSVLDALIDEAGLAAIMRGAVDEQKKTGEIHDTSSTQAG